MSFSRSIVAVAVVLAIGVLSCNILKKNESEEDIGIFLSNFESKLKLPDDEILKQFEARQSREAILAVIRIFQNKEYEYIDCALAMQETEIERDKDDNIRVSIPAILSARNLQDADSHVSTSIALWLKAKDRSFVITKIEGEKFYDDFANLRNSIQWAAERQVEIDKRRPIHAQAKALQQQYDSVIWYTTYEGKNYFYVVKGTWSNDLKDGKNQNTDCVMGLVDEAGSVLIPVAFDLIGTIGFDKLQVVEVKKNGKVGQFNITDKKLVIDTVYDMIIPIDRPDTYAYVRTDSTYGWIDLQYQYHTGLPSEKEKAWVGQFGFLPKDLSLKNGEQSLCEIPNEENIGYGIVIPPSRYVKTGLFDEIIQGLSTTATPMSGWTEYMETKGTLFQQVTEGISALMTTITERYLDGREEFYTTNRLVFMTPAHDTLAVSNIGTESIIHLKRIGESLIEVKSEPYLYWDSPFEEGLQEYDIPQFNYFSLENGAVIPLKSQRIFSFTQFVKLDSTYLTGEFHHYNVETQEKEESTFLSSSTLQFMRNEILASYGYRFKDSVDIQRFSQYAQNIDNLEDVQGQLSDVDRHNIAFLDKIIALLGDKPV